ncbi:molybdopterin biosynthesis protein [Roseomonas sp. PWR1]|uniref:Molybdopterin molybdenumtransferase n=1 Tax=Roseomonas nitratireducens TaxID=2820810 RepID=A0ABS4ART2_9PROT|nr:molybdopterin-binding protein [Neoroseomonas nitratireducens]MBP0464055.1 molybdopterin biosynthesis protein [Neoroseomonas nitratireducens]
MSTTPLRLTAPDAALAALLAHVGAPVPARHLLVAAALGHVLAEPLRAAGPVPAAPVALRDGWAVVAAETEGAGPYAPLPLMTTPRRVAAGDPLPTPANAVLPPFDLVLEGPFAQALQAIAPGEGVRGVGEEMGAGHVLRHAGERLAARDLPALAMLGVAGVAVRAPRCAWIATGDEIVADPTRDTLAPVFAALLGALGAELRVRPPVPDDPAAIAAALHAAVADHDVLLLVGGTGEGAGDRSAAGLADAGTLDVHGIGARPGMTAGGGAVACRPVLLLPGRAEDALAAWVLLLRPLLLDLMGVAAPTPATARLARSVASTVGLAELVPLRLGPDGAEPLALGALPAGALAAADGILVVPAASEGYEAGATIPICPL